MISSRRRETSGQKVDSGSSLRSVRNDGLLPYSVIPGPRAARNPDAEGRMPEANICAADGPEGERRDGANISTSLPETSSETNSSMLLQRRFHRFASLASLAAIALSWAVPASAKTAQASAPAHYASLVDEVVARYHLPGIAVGVVENGQVTFTRTVGTRAVGSGQPVNRDTLFKIASNSKAMTTALLARLVQQGKLAWDDPVTKYLPDFQMHDPWVTRNLRVADLLTHSSGLPEGGGDLMLWPGPNHFTRDDIIRGLRHIKPAYSFRSRYEYDNLLYVVAGEVAASAGNAPYETLMRREIFKPLGLDRCIVGAFDRDAVGNLAQPHRRDGTRNVVTGADPAHVPAITMAAAGGIRCSLDDMLKWARHWLDPTPAQLEWLSQTQRRILQSPHMLIPVSERRRDWDNSHIMAYGYGWRMADVDGHWSVWHTGTLSGMYSELMLLPDAKSGFVFLINGSGGDARTVLGEVLLKSLIGSKNTRSVADYADELDRAEHARRQSRVPDTSSRVAATPADLKDWLGVWRDPWFGKVRLCAAGNGVRFTAAKSPQLSGPVMRVGTRFLVQWAHGDAEAWLTPPAKGSATMHMAKVDPDADFSYDYEDLAFVRIGDCDSTPPHVGVSDATTAAEAGLVDIRTLVPDIAEDIKYAGSDNFVGTPVDGYRAPKCLLLKPVAEKLAAAERDARRQDMRLKLFDCYRPARAVAHFVRWAHDLKDTRTRTAHYPNLDKSQLLGKYIAPVSGHSRGATVDLSLMQCDKAGQCQPLDMGTQFDYFGVEAHTDWPGASKTQHANRLRLRALMHKHGFRNYPLEWWHYTLKPEPTPHLLYDVPVR